MFIGISAYNHESAIALVDNSGNLVDYYRGSENDVLKRYYMCAKKFSVQNILRITSDCPLIDPKLVDKIGKIGINIWKNMGGNL